ncbi:protein kinase activator Mob2 [Schizosaccharomyces pombe]|uniref:Maintenance of ploidy protein mob2 n=1 Tax=Schizosaccharomyces pombe (strain 972 / ATCC 24843) TaxID=284812 RepID=MOB2_SCHPO|nr:protein kinase activator Mob2 [Schizosaccharomyces pombe]O74558.1 RecName: Full=Maintenance of ploidy protein mob2 [Schizosaccharomyces pombe 972h-]CAA20697.1 protein kinase activator Mob2 [Schizosaccharomyces pombe]|eukprot:NP_587851.1 protein kinase activator Mob2 [Schizosaccharomyces pombe]
MFLLNSLSRITRGNRSKRHQNLSDASSSSGSFSKKSSTSQLVRTGSPSVEPTALYLQQPFVRTHLVKGNFSTIVSLPRFVDLDEWVALNVYELFTYLNHFYDVFATFCTVKTCPVMSAAANFDYTWLDNNRKPVHLPAPQYIEYVLAWIENRLHDQNVFPTKAGLPFPSNFLVIVKAIYKQMFRIFAHMYYAHYAEILHLSLEAHWNSFFAHFIAFGKEFQLLDKRDTAPLKDLIVVLENQGNI